MKKKIILLIMSIFLTSQAFCKETSVSPLDKKILFGHQSVGMNIIDGVKSFAGGDVQIFNVDELGSNSQSQGIYHVKIGQNEDPTKKIYHFEQLINKYGHNVDVAFFKFCYVDITKSTDIIALFKNYTEILDKLIVEYPEIMFVHWTVPLRVVQSGPKAWVKTILNKPLGGAEDNVQRNNFNKMLVSKYMNSGFIFDLAAIESTYPDGTVNTFEYNDEDYQALVPEYTDDGKHLNEKGRLVVAEQLLKFLTELPSN